MVPKIFFNKYSSPLWSYINVANPVHITTLNTVLETNSGSLGAPKKFLQLKDSVGQEARKYPWGS